LKRSTFIGGHPTRLTSIDLVGGHVQEAGELSSTRGFQKRTGTLDVGANKLARIGDAPVDMTFRGKVHHCVDALFQDVPHRVGIANVSPDEFVTGVRLEIGEVIQVSCVG